LWLSLPIKRSSSVSRCREVGKADFSVGGVSGGIRTGHRDLGIHRAAFGKYLKPEFIRYGGAAIFIIMGLVILSGKL